MRNFAQLRAPHLNLPRRVFCPVWFPGDVALRCLSKSSKSRFFLNYFCFVMSFCAPHFFFRFPLLFYRFFCLRRDLRCLVLFFCSLFRLFCFFRFNFVFFRFPILGNVNIFLGDTRAPRARDRHGGDRRAGKTAKFR